MRQTTTASVVLLAAIAAIVSYRHMHTLVLRHGETKWTPALLPLSVDGMIAASSMTLLADSLHGRRGGALPWALLVAGSAASPAANIAVAEPTLIGRLIAAWPSFALIGSYELLMRQIRQSAQQPTEPATARTPQTRDRTPEAARAATTGPGGGTTAPNCVALAEAYPSATPRRATTSQAATLWGPKTRPSPATCALVRGSPRRAPEDERVQQIRRNL